MSSKCLLHFERQYCSVLSVLLNILEFSIFSKGNFCLAIYPPLQQAHIAHAGVCLFRHRMRWLGRQLKQGAPFYLGKLMMWFPQSWWWNMWGKRLQWVASHLLCLMIFSHIASELGQGKGSHSVCRELVSGRICPLPIPHPPYSLFSTTPLNGPATCLTWPWHWHYNNTQLKVETDLIVEYELYLLFVTLPTG